MLNLNKYEFYVYSLKRGKAISETEITTFKYLNGAIEFYKNEIKKSNLFVNLGIKDKEGEIDLLLCKDGYLKFSNDFKFTHFNKDKLVTNNIMNILKDNFVA